MLQRDNEHRNQRQRARIWRRFAGFSLVELLVVIGIIAVLIGLLLPVLGNARAQARRTRCLSNLHQTSIAIHGYASVYKGRIPYGPTASGTNPISFYQSTGSVTSLISTLDVNFATSPPSIVSQYCGLGLLIQSQLANIPHVLFCPDVMQGDIADEQLSYLGVAQAQSDYYYRHGCETAIPPDVPKAGTSYINLAKLGNNSQGKPIRALAMDVDFETTWAVNLYKINTRTCHDRKTVNILYADGHAQVADNRKRDFTVDATTDIRDALNRILANFEKADALVN